MTQEELKRLLHYDPETGVFTWLPRPREMFATQRAFGLWNSRFAGQRAGSKNPRGCRVIRLGKRLWPEHQLAWLWVNGALPAPEADHENGVRDDNRIDNLREASRRQNSYNRGLRRDNASGRKGVHLHRRTGKWRASITVNGKKHCLGLHVTKEAAHAAYSSAAGRLHGAFARAE